MLFEYFNNRPLYVLNRKPFLADNRTLFWLSIVTLITMLLIRSWENFSHPGFYAEDATYYFKLNYNADFLLENIFRNPNGYYNIANNFFAQLLGDIDIRYQALAYQVLAFSFTVGTIVLFSRIGLIQNKFLVFLTPLLLGLSGFNHIFYYITITFQMYVLVLTLFSVLLLDRQESMVKNIVIFVAIPLLVWSGPYSVLAVPFALTFLVLFRGRTWIMLWTIGVTVAYALSTTGSMIMWGNIFVERFQILWFEALVRDIFLLGLRDHANLEKVLLLVAIFAPAIYAIRRDTFHLRVLVLFMVIIVSSMAPLFLSKKIIMYGLVYPCHLLLAKFFWLLSLLIIIDRLLLVATPRFQKAAATAAACFFAVFIVIDNTNHPEMRKIEVLYHIPKFLQTIHETEKLGLEKRNEKIKVIAKGSGIFTPMTMVGSRNPDAQLVKTLHIDKSDRAD